MDNRFINWCRGYVKVKLVGREKERFINLCIVNNITIINLQRNEEDFYMCLKAVDYKNTKSIVRKTKIIPQIVKKIGLPFIYMKYKNKKSFFIGCILALFIFYICSLFIWSIEVEGECYYTDEELIRFMEERNIKSGVKTSRVNCHSIERIIRERYNDIGWVSVQIKGCRLIVSIKENVKYNIDKLDNAPAHLIAPNSGIIESIVLRKGEIKVPVGQNVKKGEVIISGVVDILDDAKEVIDKKGIHADADIYIKYDREYYNQIKREHKYKAYSGKKKRFWKIFYKNKQIFRGETLKKIDNYDVIVNNYNVSLNKNIDTFFRLDVGEKCEYIYKNVRYKDDELNKLIRNEYNKYRDRLKNNNCLIKGNNIEYILNDKMIIAKGYVTISEKVSTYKKIRSKELYIEQKKEDVQGAGVVR